MNCGNPVNHRVFETRVAPEAIRPRHACLGVTHPSPLHLPPLGREAERGGHWPPVGAQARGWPKIGPAGDVRHDERWISHGSASRGHVASRAPRDRARDPRSRPRVRRDHPLSLSISISGGKETYKDSLVTATSQEEPGLRIGRPRRPDVVRRSVLAADRARSPTGRERRRG